MLTPEEVTRRKAELEERREWKKSQRRKNWIARIFLIIFGIVLLVTSGLYSYRKGLNKAPTVTTQTPSFQRTNILFLGLDDKSVTASRTDIVMLVAIDPNSGAAGVISIPRDTRVLIPERDKWDRINAAHAYGGPELTVKTVAEFLQVPIDYYIETDFAGFSKIIDTLGGVEIDVDKDMHYVDQAQDLYIDIQAGKQVFDGETALEYVRYRDELGDISLIDPQYQGYGGRVMRQRKFVVSLFEKFMQPATILKLPRLIGQLWDAVDTNIPWSLALKLVFVADEITFDTLETAVVPGTSEVINGAWYWIADETRTRQMVNNIVYGLPKPLTAEVLNGAGIAGVANEVSSVLHQDIVEVLRVGNAEHFQYATSQVLVNSEADVQRVAGIASMLSANVLVNPARDSKTDVTIIIGRNYKPL